MPFVICLAEKPLSANATLRRGYTERIAAEARMIHADPHFKVPLYSRIIWFHRGPAQGDSDNIAKRIHDALKHIVFEDDSIITHTMAVRVDISSQAEIVADGANPDAFERLTQMLSDTGNKHVLYIEIGKQNGARIYLGPLR